MSGHLVIDENENFPLRDVPSLAFICLQGHGEGTSHFLNCGKLFYLLIYFPVRNVNIRHKLTKKEVR